jgi:hypothetical protein
MSGRAMAGAAAAMLVVWLALPVSFDRPEPKSVPQTVSVGTDAMAEWELLFLEEDGRQESLAGYGDFPAQDIGEEFLSLVYLHEDPDQGI